MEPTRYDSPYGFTPSPASANALTFSTGYDVDAFLKARRNLMLAGTDAFMGRAGSSSPLDRGSQPQTSYQSVTSFANGFDLKAGRSKVEVKKNLAGHLEPDLRSSDSDYNLGFESPRLIIDDGTTSSSSGSEEAPKRARKGKERLVVNLWKKRRNDLASTSSGKVSQPRYYQQKTIYDPALAESKPGTKRRNGVYGPRGPYRKKPKSEEALQLNKTRRSALRQMSEIHKKSAIKDFSSALAQFVPNCTEKTAHADLMEITLCYIVFALDKLMKGQSERKGRKSALSEANKDFIKIILASEVDEEEPAK